MDVFSRYIVHYRLLRVMDGQTVSTEMAAALETVPKSVRRQLVVQSDNGSPYIPADFSQTLSCFRVKHKRIRPHTPTDNAEVERFNRTMDDSLADIEGRDYPDMAEEIDGIIDYCNNERLHSSLKFLRPADYYRGTPETLLAERRRKLKQARELRKQENLKLKQKKLPWMEDQNVA